MVIITWADWSGTAESTAVRHIATHPTYRALERYA